VIGQASQLGGQPALGAPAPKDYQTIQPRQEAGDLGCRDAVRDVESVACSHRGALRKGSDGPRASPSSETRGSSVRPADLEAARAAAVLM
jgi:hypothetical protein